MAIARARAVCCAAAGSGQPAIARPRGRSPATAMRLSAGSVRPPGNTNLPGMKAWRLWRRPIRTLTVVAVAVEQEQGRRIAWAHRLAAERKVFRIRPCRPGLSSCLPCGDRSEDSDKRNAVCRLRLHGVLAAEAVHVERPLQADDRALDRLQQRRPPGRW